MGPTINDIEKRRGIPGESIALMYTVHSYRNTLEAFQAVKTMKKRDISKNAYALMYLLCPPTKP